MSNFFTHIEHFEDYFLDYRNLPRLQSFIDDISLGLNTTVNHKVDGNIMIIFGINKFNSKFFIATKSGVSVSSPKFIYSVEDIFKHYPGDDRISLRQKLTCIFKYLNEWFKTIADDNDLIFQCDILFAHPYIRKHTSADQFIFQPNTVVYKTTDKDLKDSVVGICIHSAYINRSDKEALQLEKYKGLFACNIESTSDVFVCSSKANTISSTYKDLHNLLPRIDTPLCNEHIEKSSRTYISNKIKDYLHHGNCSQLGEYNIHSYARSTLKLGEGWWDDVLLEMHANEITRRFSSAYIDRANIPQKDMRMFVLTAINLLRIKYYILNKITKINTHFLKDGKSFINDKETQGEGWVVTHNELELKFIDRAEFSQAHFLK